MTAMLLTDLTLAAMDPAAPGLLPQAAIALDGNRILWSGPQADLPPEHRARPSRSLQGRLVTPALIDCHTHLLHAGHRAAEFEARLNGATYEQIARAGGGILSTVRATRAATEDDLVQAALPRLDALLADGIGTLEIKSGYGLDVETELRMLRAARRLSNLRPVQITTAFLGAHAIPPEFAGRAGDYLTRIVLPTLRAAQEEGLVDAVDGFCEGIAFSPEEIAILFTEAKALNLPVKLHAEQLSHLGGATLAAQYNALSADHLEYATEDDARAMGASGTVAVLLPGAFYCLRERQAPPVAAFRAHGVPMALATDSNPGSSPLSSLLLAMNMGCTLWGLTVAEVWEGTTTHAARALRLPDRGRIAPGFRADLAIWDAETPAELVYRLGARPLHARIHGGHWC